MLALTPARILHLWPLSSERPYIVSGGRHHILVMEQIEARAQLETIDQGRLS